MRHLFQIQKLTALAYIFDQWPGVLVNPELLASFVMPNHPVVNSMIQLTSQYLDKWTKDPSLAGYQYGDPNRVKNMAAAAYAAIQQKNITYAEPPSSFESSGQRTVLQRCSIRSESWNLYGYDTFICCMSGNKWD